MIQFSANLGFLWTDRSLPDAIRSAKAAGFHAVECHWPYAYPAEEIRSVLQETGLKMLGLNTTRGNVDAGDNGLAAVVDRQTEARGYIDEAIDYARAIDCPNIHVMAGFTDKGIASQATFVENLTYACKAAADCNKTILIEPLNSYDAPGYHVSTLQEAQTTLLAVDAPNLKIMFDCYHMQIMGGDVLNRFAKAVNDIGHVQFASVPDRAEPNIGELNYVWLLNAMATVGFDGPFGAEYKPQSSTDESLDWMNDYTRDAPAI